MSSSQEKDRQNPLVSHISLDQLKRALHQQILSEFSEIKPQSKSRTGIETERIIRIINDKLGLFVLVQGVNEPGSFPIKSKNMLGLDAYNLISNSEFDSIKEEGKVDLNQLTAEDWRYLQLALQALSQEE